MKAVKIASLLFCLAVGTSAFAQFPDGLDLRGYDTGSSEPTTNFFGDTETSLTSPTPLIVTVTANPSNPGPGDQVTIKVETFSTDLTRAIITWLEDNEPIRSGVGLTTHTVQAGPVGSAKVVTVIIEAADGFVHRESVDIRPAVVDLMWEASSTVPPFYKGKALYPILGTIRIVAFPYMVDENGNVLNPDTMTYTWRKNGRVVGDRSGYQKRTIVFGENDSIYRTPFEIRLVVSDASGKYYAETKLEIPSAEQALLFYENNSIFGTLYNRVLGSRFDLKEKELSLEASPYFLDSPSRRDSQMRYEWTINRDTFTKYGEPIIVLRNDNTTGGRTDVSLELYNERKILEGAREGLSIYFNAGQ